MRLASRNLLIRSVRLLLGALLFAQIALAAEACVAPDVRMAFASGAVSENCHEGSRNACLLACTQGDQMSDSKPAPTSMPALIAGPIAVVTPPAAAPVAGLQPSLLAHRTDPPLCIRHCRLLN